MARLHGQQLSGAVSDRHGYRHNLRTMSLDAGAGADEGDLGFEVSLDATRKEPANDQEPEHGVMLRATIRWYRRPVLAGHL